LKTSEAVIAYLGNSRPFWVDKIGQIPAILRPIFCPDLGAIWVKSYLETRVDSAPMISEENSTKMSRRAALKTMLGAAAVVVAVPHLGTLNLLGKTTETQAKPIQAPFDSMEEPLVILVRKDGVRGFKGQTEYSLKDSAAAQQIVGAFSNARQV
jgi:hypothetical protein